MEMAPIVATAPRSRRLEIKGFYERKYWGELVSGGTFHTAADIERRRPVLISHMIADEMGIRLECGLRVSSCRILNGRGASRFMPGGCEMSVWVDGVNIGKGSPDTVVKAGRDRGSRNLQGTRLSSGRVRRIRFRMRGRRHLDEVVPVSSRPSQPQPA